MRTVLQLIAEESNLNIVASDTVQGNVTLRLINVPWDQALDIVLRAKGLDKRRDGNVVWVAPQAEIAKYEQAKEDARIAHREPRRDGHRVHPDQLRQRRGHRQAADRGQQGQQRRRRCRRRRRPAAARLPVAARQHQLRPPHQHAAGHRHPAEGRRDARPGQPARQAGRPGADRSPHRDRHRIVRPRTGRQVRHQPATQDNVLFNGSIDDNIATRNSHRRSRSRQQRDAAAEPAGRCRRSPRPQRQPARVVNARRLAGAVDPQRRLRARRRALGAADRRPRRSDLQPAHRHQQPEGSGDPPGPGSRLRDDLAAAGRRRHRRSRTCSSRTCCSS